MTGQLLFSQLTIFTIQFRTQDAACSITQEMMSGKEAQNPVTMTWHDLRPLELHQQFTNTI
eukprot:scaffold4007_cov49-Cyclotella_meneghiniana.AAC.7